ncbi:hypothetical protein C8J56DRAFT_1065438 [Mycena floridula]|nr:hypothetical protein C8J56DRAFT_1065438 [Mycena floridula]
MLTINDHVDKLDAAWVDFVSWGMLTALLFEATPVEPELLDEEDEAEAAGPRILGESANTLRTLMNLQYDYNSHCLWSSHAAFCISNPEATDQELDNLTVDECPEIVDTVHIFASAVVAFYAPSDISGLEECAAKGSAQHQITYPCVLVWWYSRVADEPDDEMGMWIVKPDIGDAGLDVIHLDSVLQGAHLIGRAGTDFMPQIKFTDALDAFQFFYVNKYADHHVHEIAF